MYSSYLQISKLLVRQGSSCVTYELARKHKSSWLFSKIDYSIQDAIKVEVDISTNSLCSQSPKVGCTNHDMPIL